MQRQKRNDDDEGDGDGRGGSSSSTTTTTTTHSSQTSVTTITTTSKKITTSTTITTLVTSINSPGNPPNTGQSGPGQSSVDPTSGGGGRITPPQSLPPNQNVPSGSSSSNPSTATVSSSSSSSTSQPVFLFNDLMNATVCSPFGLSWTYSGPTSVAMTLSIQQSISQSNSAAISSNLPSGSPATMRILTTNALSNADTFIWTSVDVMEGWYIAKAFDTSATLGISAGSIPFFVIQGNDTSCLLKVPTTTSNPLPSQSTSSGSSRSSIGTGDIVGITLGVTAGAICLLLALFTIPRLKPRDDPSIITGPTKPRRPYLLY